MKRLCSHQDGLAVAGRARALSHGVSDGSIRERRDVTQGKSATADPAVKATARKLAFAGVVRIPRSRVPTDAETRKPD